VTSEAFTQISTIITIIGTGIGTLSIQMYRESRNRRWDLEDRQRVADALKAEVAALAAKTAQDHQHVADALALDAVRAQAARDALAVTVAETLAETERKAIVERDRVAADLLAQRTRVAEELTRHQQASAQDLAAIAATLAAQDDASTKTREDLITATVTNAAAIDGVRQAADQAYQEANHVNAKIENLNMRLAEARTIAVHTSDAVDAGRKSADSAYQEANHVNTKIEDLNRRLVQAELEGPLPKIQRAVEVTYQTLIEGQAALVEAFEHDRRNRKTGALAIQAAIAALATQAAALHEAEVHQPPDPAVLEPVTGDRR